MRTVEVRFFLQKLIKCPALQTRVYIREYRPGEGGFQLLMRGIDSGGGGEKQRKAEPKSQPGPPAAVGDEGHDNESRSLFSPSSLSVACRPTAGYRKQHRCADYRSKVDGTREFPRHRPLLWTLEAVSSPKALTSLSEKYTIRNFPLLCPDFKEILHCHSHLGFARRLLFLASPRSMFL